MPAVSGALTYRIESAPEFGRALETGGRYGFNWHRIGQ